MFVGDRMSHPAITVPSDMPIHDAINLMRQKNIRRLPVVNHGKLVGIVSHGDLLNASPSPATSLSVWEMNYLLSKITIDQIMTKQVLTVTEDTPIEEAARLMADRHVAGLPVVRGKEVVGIITETDLFKIFLELLGARDPGVRVTVIVPEQAGVFARITKPIADAGGNIIALGTFAGQDAAHAEVVLKVENLDAGRLRALLTPLVDKVIDVR